MRTLLFCTSFARSQDEWNGRYKSWFDYYSSCDLRYDQLLIFDDGSPEMPTFCSKETIYTFQNHIGKNSVSDYGGWYRSVSTAIHYAKENGFDKIVHCESDAYLLSQKIIRFVNLASHGWHSMWCPRHSIPESAIQIICQDQIDSAIEFFSKPYDAYRNQIIDSILPYTQTHHMFIGDRYGESQDVIPEGVDYSCQTSPNMINNYKLL